MCDGSRGPLLHAAGAERLHVALRTACRTLKLVKLQAVMTVSSADQLLTRSQVASVLRENFDALSKEFHVASFEIFGSYARDEQTPQSDVDLLVTFSRPVGFGFIHLAERLEALLGKPVDLLASDGIKPNRRDSILASLIHAAP